MMQIKDLETKPGSFHHQCMQLHAYSAPIEHTPTSHPQTNQSNHIAFEIRICNICICCQIHKTLLN